MLAGLPAADQAPALRALLQRWSPRTLAAHMRRIKEFGGWRTKAPRRAPLAARVQTEVARHEQLLLQYLREVAQHSAHGGALRRRLASLAFANQLARPDYPIPVATPTVATLAKGH